jgi:hypothetical protein
VEGNVTVSDERFFQVPRTPRRTSQGEIDFPILYYDTSALLAFFLADRASVATVLAGTGLRPGVTFGAKALAGLAFYEYRDSSIGAYNEVGVAVPVVPVADPPRRGALLELFQDPRQRRLGFYILDLPVTTAVANAGGREIWGYPKFVTEIPLHFGRGEFAGRVLDPAGGEPILALSGSYGPGISLPGMDLLLYSELKGRRLRTVVDVKGRFHTTSGRGMRLEVGRSRHGMAERLRALGLEGARPLLVQVCSDFKSRLNLGDPLD